jgi:hypothetical protein
VPTNPVFAILLKAVFTSRAMLAAVHHAADADDIAGFGAGHMFTECRDMADDLMPR